MRYALVDDKGNINRFALNIDPTVATRPPWRWLPVQDVEPPTVANTQVVEGQTYVVLADRVEVVWPVRNKSAGELNAAKEATVGNVDSVLLQIAFRHENDIRALRSQPPITVAQFRAAIKDLL